MTNIDELTSAECKQLLERHHFGRLAFLDQVGVMPMIIPVNYLYHRDAVIFRTDPGSKLTAAIHNEPVAFEIDGIEEDERVGWSVVIRGHVEDITDEDELEELRQTPLVPYASGAKASYVRVNQRQLSGRRITAADVPSNWFG
ncbi:MAG TPA: pyridoxamine 5'-phosphate oxidase family protein [Propionibacteriaceae bacterium]|nr:pyridoxamine 5'-phosphate oxidase family protein [Propionibacteriaceae bacterium]